jgi:hypothetical protein
MSLSSVPMEVPLCNCQILCNGAELTEMSLQNAVVLGFTESECALELAGDEIITKAGQRKWREYIDSAPLLARRSWQLVKLDALLKNLSAHPTIGMSIETCPFHYRELDVQWLILLKRNGASIRDQSERSCVVISSLR